MISQFHHMNRMRFHGARKLNIMAEEVITTLSAEKKAHIKNRYSEVGKIDIRKFNTYNDI